MIRFIIPFIFLSIGIASASVKKDSIGVENKGGKNYILHRIDPKETLFSLSKRYQVSIDEIIATNPDAKEGLKIASVLRIPAPERTVSLPASRKHVVQSSETLYSISRKYNIDIEKIVSANRLSDHNLKVGQELLIPATSNQQSTNTVQASNASNDPTKVYHTVLAGETLFSLSRAYMVDVDQIKRWNHLADNNLKLGQIVIVGDKTRSDAITNANVAGPKNVSAGTTTRSDEAISANPTTTTTPPTTAATASEDIKKYKIEDNEYLKNKSSSTEQVRIEKFLEAGFAELIEGSDDTKKYLALHKTAPVGTIMQVKNEMNDLSVFVRVIGKLPDTGENEKIRIRLSKIAYDHLGAIDARFPVQISYIPR